jgi:hypothetical protein
MNLLHHADVRFDSEFVHAAERLTANTAAAESDLSALLEYFPPSLRPVPEDRQHTEGDLLQGDVQHTEDTDDAPAATWNIAGEFSQTKDEKQIDDSLDYE